MSSDGRPRVAVVGAGCSGLAAVKSCLEAGLQPVCFEREGDLGGLWRYTEDARVGRGGAYRNLVINTSKEMMAFSDFPPPPDFPSFLPHTHVLRYFRLYAEHFRLTRHIRFRTSVVSVSKAPDYQTTGRWLVVSQDCPLDEGQQADHDEGHDETGAGPLEDWPSARRGSAPTPGGDTEAQGSRRGGSGEAEAWSDGAKSQTSQGQEQDGGLQAPKERTTTTTTRTEVFDGVMICTGHHTVPYCPALPGKERFRGSMRHSHAYRKPEDFLGRRVLIVGFGNSAVDIAVDLSRTASEVLVSSRRGSWIIGKSGFWGIPADMIANSRAVLALPKSWLQWLVERQADFKLDHARAGIRPPNGALQAHPTINDDFPNCLITGKVKVRPDIRTLTPDGVTFVDGSWEAVDDVILATGYDYRVDFVDQSVLRIQENRVDLYKYMLPPGLPHPSLAVIGMVQAIGAVVPISELQTRWFVQLLKGTVRLPTTDVMLAEMERKRTNMANTYVTSRRHTLQTYWIDYMDEIASQIGARPALGAMLCREPGLALRCLLGACLPYQYRLQGPHPWHGARQAIRHAYVRATRTCHAPAPPPRHKPLPRLLASPPAAHLYVIVALLVFLAWLLQVLIVQTCC